MFAKLVQRDVQVGEETVTVRKLAAKTLDKARIARRADQVQSIRDLGADLIKAFREGKEASGVKEEESVAVAEVPEPTAEEKAAARKATFGDYDRYVVLQAGIVRWTAKQDGKPVPVSPQTIDELDEESAQLLFEAIMDLSAPVLNAEELRGKD